jgi:HNH endonuclease
MSEYRRPATPLGVERQLRQESGFGCARCGHPYIEYHHIIPYAEEAHFRPEDMVALCGNCHVAVAKMRQDVQYKLKNNAFNIKNGLFKGVLEYDKRDLIFKIGGCFYENVDTVLQYQNQSIISCKLADGQAKVSLTLLDEAGILRLSIVDNEVIF